MTGLWAGVLPAATVAAAAYALRPAEPVIGARRLAVVRAALAVGTYAVITVELLSRFHRLNGAGVVSVWLLGLTAAATAAVLRRRYDGAAGAGWPGWRRVSIVEWLMAGALVAIGLGTLLTAVVAEPNNWDSQSYHLPKIEHWISAGSVEPYATTVMTQVALAPGAEYVLLHLRLLTGGDDLYNLLQWAAGLLCAVAASRIAAQLGAQRFGQLTAAFVIGTAPMVVLQASSTQTDLIVAAWAACAATLILDGARRRTRVSDVLLLGSATGLVLVTKATGLLAIVALLAMWFVLGIWRRPSAKGSATMIGSARGVAAVALILAGPFFIRQNETFGHPLGPEALRGITTMDRHDPAAIVVNGARLLQTATMLPLPRVNAHTAGVVAWFAQRLGVDPSDPAITSHTFPLTANGFADEDLAPYPVQVLAVIAGLGYCLAARRRDRVGWSYACGVLAVGVVFAATLKWQPWVNRLFLPALAVAAPLAGLAAEALWQRTRATVARLAVTPALALVSVAAAAGGLYAVAFGSPRPLAGHQSVLTADPMATRFGRIPAQRADYEWAAATVRAAGARRIGLVDGGSRYEYPWWVLLRDRELVMLKSATPGVPAAEPGSVDAIICYESPLRLCDKRVPAGWRLESRQYVAVALPQVGNP